MPNKSCHGEVESKSLSVQEGLNKTFQRPGGSKIKFGGPGRSKLLEKIKTN